MTEKNFEKAKRIIFDLKEVNRNIETLDYTPKNHLRLRKIHSIDIHVKDEFSDDMRIIETDPEILAEFRAFYINRLKEKQSSLQKEFDDI